MNYFTFKIDFVLINGIIRDLMPENIKLMIDASRFFFFRNVADQPNSP